LDVVLEKDELFTFCSYNSTCSKEPSRVKVEVKNSATKPSSEFYYVVSAGKIIGQGSSVVWDLTDTAPGKYTLTVGIGEDDVIFGKTISKTLTLTECPVCDPPHSCPSLSISGPSKALKPGSTFRVKGHATEGTDMGRIRYSWQVENGEIIIGQRTDTILVTAKTSTTSNVRVSLKISGDGYDLGCVTEVSEIFRIARK
jgi:hypothetical protein